MKASRKTKIITCLIISLIAFKFSGYGGTTNKTEKTYEGTYEVIVVKIYDGDTITVNIPAFPDIIGHNINNSLAESSIYCMQKWYLQLTKLRVIIK